jgi:hypothetical protein
VFLSSKDRMETARRLKTRFREKPVISYKPSAFISASEFTNEINFLPSRANVSVLRRIICVLN